MALLPVDHDVPFLLSRLRPGAEWGWKGGTPRQTTNVDWRDGVQIEPTEAEYLAEHILFQGELIQAQTTRTDQLTRIGPLVGQNPKNLTIPETGHLVEELMVRAKALDENGDIIPLADWGSGVGIP